MEVGFWLRSLSEVRITNKNGHRMSAYRASLSLSLLADQLSRQGSGLAEMKEGCKMGAESCEEGNE